MDTTPQTNSNAVLCIVLGTVAMIVPIIGIVTGIIGIVYYRKAKGAIAQTGEAGEGIAITGLVFSIVGLALQVLIILSFVAFFGLMMLGIIAEST